MNDSFDKSNLISTNNKTNDQISKRTNKLSLNENFIHTVKKDWIYYSDKSNRRQLGRIVSQNKLEYIYVYIFFVELIGVIELSEYDKIIC